MDLIEFIKKSRVDHIVLRHGRSTTFRGSLVITGHYLPIRDESSDEDFQLPLRAVDLVELQKTGAYCTLILRCKNFLTYELQLPSEEDAQDVQASIEALSNVQSVAHHLAFDYKPDFTEVENGWAAFSLENEIGHLAGDMTSWRISNVNKDHRICRSYPEQVVVPRSVTDDIIIASAKFRHANRFPVLSFYHRERGTCLLKSSQPLCGSISGGKRCREDESLVNAVLGKGLAGLMLDTRSLGVIAAAAKKKGGTEAELHYPRWRKFNWSGLDSGLERFSGIQTSFVKLAEACCDPNISVDKWLGRIESSKWLDHVKSILHLSCLMAVKLDAESTCILIHGAEGTDTTLQITSLVQILLVPDCRTIRGMQALIDREWLQGGHPFAQRCARGPFSRSEARMESPVFLLFLDCVWQLWKQFPCSFEYSEEFLMLLAEQPYFSRFGTFLCNNMYERRAEGVVNRTTSLWSYINRPGVIEDMTNPLYEPPTSGRYAIWPSVKSQSLHLWTELYSKQAVNSEQHKVMRQEVADIKSRNMELRSKASKMRRTVLTLQRQAIEKGLIPPPTAVEEK